MAPEQLVHCIQLLRGLLLALAPRVRFAVQLFLLQLELLHAAQQQRLLLFQQLGRLHERLPLLQRLLHALQLLLQLLRMADLALGFTALGRHGHEMFHGFLLPGREIAHLRMQEPVLLAELVVLVLQMHHGLPLQQRHGHG